MAVSLSLRSTGHEHDPFPTTSPLSARVVVGDLRGSAALEVDQVKLGRRGLVFSFPWVLHAGRHAWVEVTLPSGKRVRPLVAVLGRTDEGLTSARYVHVFPEHRRALDAYLASPSGY
jgi:hypothetical protein